MWTGREAGAPSQEINPCQKPGSPGMIFIILRRDPLKKKKKKHLCLLLNVMMEFCFSFRFVSPLLGLQTPIHLDQPLPAEPAVSDPILAVAYRRTLGHIESWRHLPEEKCILGQLHVLPSVLLHNLKDVERKERRGSNRERRVGGEGGLT